MIWTDSTSYSRGDTARKPAAWTTRIGDLYITVTTGHIHHRGRWVMHCHTIGMDTVLMDLLDTASPQEAQQMAVDWVRVKVYKWAEQLKTEH